MHDTKDSYNFSEESSNDPKKSNKTKIDNSSFPIGKQSLHPIDETDEFHDPFSDLNLFLSKKIQSTVKKHGSTKKWSSQIQDELIKGILPEFKSKFPNYRLGLSALKKVWEKVSYYYGKVSIQKEAISENGKLNIHYMIKQNLQDYLSNYPVVENIPTATAHKLAVKLSECIATLEGERPRVDHLTKTIWAAQKHLMKNLAVKHSKNPFEEYDKLDKLIVKTLLEKTSSKSYKYEDLTKSLKRTLNKLNKYVHEFRSQEIYQHIAKKLAKKLFPTRSFFQSMDESTASSVEQFILFQLETLSHDPTQSFTEMTQRILAIYPLLANLPKNISIEALKNAIPYFLSDSHEDDLENLDINPSLAIFLTTECHFLRRKDIYKTYDAAENYLVKTVKLAKELPLLLNEQLEELEIFIWNIYDTIVEDNHKYEDLIENELSVAILDSKSYSFQNTVYMVLHYFQKAKESLSGIDFSKTKKEAGEIDRKIEIWALQNDMLCRYLHFDPKHEILVLMNDVWSKKKFKSHNAFVNTIVKEYALKHFSNNLSVDGLEKRVWILYKFFWYNQLSKPEETTFHRFSKWHSKEISYDHKELQEEQKIQILEKRILEKLPLTPFSPEELKKA